MIGRVELSLLLITATGRGGKGGRREREGEDVKEEELMEGREEREGDGWEKSKRREGEGEGRCRGVVVDGLKRGREGY